MLFFLMIRRPPRSTLDRSSAASDVYKRQVWHIAVRLTQTGADFGQILRGELLDSVVTLALDEEGSVPEHGTGDELAVVAPGAGLVLLRGLLPAGRDPPGDLQPSLFLPTHVL